MTQHPIYIIPHQIDITDVTQLVLSVMCCVYLGFPFLFGHDTWERWWGTVYSRLFKVRVCKNFLYRDGRAILSVMIILCCYFDWNDIRKWKWMVDLSVFCQTKQFAGFYFLSWHVKKFPLFKNTLYLFSGYVLRKFYHTAFCIGNIEFWTCQVVVRP